MVFGRAGADCRRCGTPVADGREPTPLPLPDMPALASSTPSDRESRQASPGGMDPPSGRCTVPGSQPSRSGPGTGSRSPSPPGRCHHHRSRTRRARQWRTSRAKAGSSFSTSTTWPVGARPCSTGPHGTGGTSSTSDCTTSATAERTARSRASFANSTSPSTTSRWTTMASTPSCCRTSVPRAHGARPLSRPTRRVLPW